jgi:putative DNA primase/helicase
MNTSSIRAADIESEPVKWLWRRRIPRGMLTLVAGRPGQGKSLFAAFLAAQASATGNVIYSSREDPLRQVLRPRLEAAGARLERVHLLALDLPEDTPLLEREIACRQANLLVLDPLAAHLSVSLHNDQAVRQALSPLTKIAERSGCAVLLISHTIKSLPRRAHPLDAIGGSGGGLAAACRIAYIFATDPQDSEQRILATAKSNIGPEPDSLRFGLGLTEPNEDEEDGVAYLLERTECELTASELLRASLAGSRQSEKRAKAEDWLIGELCFGAKPSDELRERATKQGISERTLRRASDKLGIVKGRGPGATWALPDGLLERLDGLLERELRELLSGNDGQDPVDLS